MLWCIQQIWLGTQLWSLEDEVLEGLAEADFRFIPNKEDHSIAWVLWHLARIEDVTMNMLVAGSPQILTTSNWLQKMEFNSSETGNALDKAGISLLSKDINIDKLRAYRLAVGRRTREIVRTFNRVISERKWIPIGWKKY